MKILKYCSRLFASFLAVILLAACTGNFEDLNTDGNKITEGMLEADMLAIGAFIPAMQLDIVPTSDIDANEYQRAQNLSGDIFSGYMAAIGEWGASHNGTYYLYYTDWNDLAFQVAYKKVIGAWNQIITRAEKHDMVEAMAFADIHKVLALHRLTDNHGPIPYSEAGKGALGARYDAQEKVYEQMFTDLDNAIKVLSVFVGENPDARPLKKFDLIYLGDYRAWIKLANTLKLRLALRLMYVDEALAQQYAEEAVSHPIGVMTSNADNALLKTGLGVNVYNPLQVCWDSYADVRSGASLESFLKGFNDPRLTKYMQAGDNGNYNGVRNGLVVTSKTAYKPLSSPNVLTSTPVQWILATEAYFLRAEGAAKGWNMAASDGISSTGALYNKGIELSFEQHGVSSYFAMYIADVNSKQANFTDILGVNNATATTTITIKWNEADSFEKKQERIITQKWLALFPNGQEAWTELRRTGYPKIFQVVRNNSNGIINTQEGVRRLPFPSDEHHANSTNVNEAISLLDGPDNGASKVWWDKKK